MENRWINPRLQNDDDITELRHKYRLSSNKLLIINDFLTENSRYKLSNYLYEIASYEENFAVINQEQIEVDKQTFEQTDPAYRFYTHQSIVDKIPDNPLDSSYIAYLKFRTALDQELSTWFSLITGEHHCDASKSVLAKFHQQGDILGWHHDDVSKRNLCVNLYLTDQWLPEKGGLFLYKESKSNTVNEIEPLANRCVMFDPRQHLSHCITPILVQGWKRHAITFWYSSQM